MQHSRKENLIIFLILAILSIAMIYSAYQIPAGSSLGQGADFMPKIVGYLLSACAIGFLYQGLKAPKEDTKAEKFDFVPLIRFGIALGLLVVYVLLLKTVGFVIMTALYIFAQSLFMVPPEKRNILISAILAVVSSVAIYLVFTRGLSLLLPAGILKNIL